tara:strand:- start:5651 stop:7207 length:1557 start_codon:yes stop_codon:yes gene_type:complete
MVNSPIHTIVILGGGAAGWLTAGILAAAHGAKSDLIKIKLIESPDVGILGVGEGTWPTMRQTLQKIGLQENEFLTRCDASFKQGTFFSNWHNQQQDDYFHPFSLPQGYFDTDILNWWLTRPGSSLAMSLCSQTPLCARQRAPKQPQTPEYAGVLNYGYHLDAGKFTRVLKEHITGHLGVEHIEDHIDGVVTAGNGNITALQSRHHGLVAGNLFIDCSGFAARLIGQHYGIGLTPVRQGLLNDTALAVQVPYCDNQQSIASVTKSIAQKNGWIWDIGLQSRKGVGYVFSSQHTSETEASQTLQAYLNADQTTSTANEGEFRCLKFTPGYRQTLWQNNCVAVGTAAGFVEPLEASALVMVELAAQFISAQLPADQTAMAPVARQFNRMFVQRWQRIEDFLQLHYVLSQRRDSDYWRAVTHRANCSEQLQDWLIQWQHRPPQTSDFLYHEEIFPAASYAYILYGMGFKTTLRKSLQHQVDQAKGQYFYQQNQRLVQQQLQGLPDNRTLLNHLSAATLQHSV